MFCFSIAVFLNNQLYWHFLYCFGFNLQKIFCRKSKYSKSTVEYFRWYLTIHVWRSRKTLLQSVGFVLFCFLSWVHLKPCCTAFVSTVCLKADGKDFHGTNLKVAFFRKCYMFFKSPNLQKWLFQITILKLKFEFPAHNSKQLVQISSSG